MKNLILLFLIMSVSLFSETISEIRNNDNYLYGYGEGKSYEQANKKALKDLVSKISVKVEAKFEKIGPFLGGNPAVFCKVDNKVLRLLNKCKNWKFFNLYI